MSRETASTWDRAEGGIDDGADVSSNPASEIQSSLSSDPFITARGSWNEVWPLISSTYATTGLPDFSGNVFQESVLLRDHWLPLCLTEPALLATTILLAQSLRPDASQHQARLSWWKTHCLRLNKEAMADPIRCQSDAILASIATLLTYESLFGEANARALHLQGLRHIVRLRGSITAPGIGWVVRRSVIWIDRFQAFLDSNLSPSQSVTNEITNMDFLLDPVQPDRGLGRALDPVHPAREALTFYDPHFDTQNFLHRRLIGIWFPGQDLMDAIEELGTRIATIEPLLGDMDTNKSQLQDLCEDMQNLQESLKRLGSRMLQKDFVHSPDPILLRQGLVHEGIRLCTLLISNTLLEFVHATTILGQHKDHTLQSLALLQLERLLESDPVVLLWIVCTLLTCTETYLRTRFERLAGAICQKLQLQTEKAIRILLSSILYNPRMHDGIIKMLSTDVKPSQPGPSSASRGKGKGKGGSTGRG